MSPIETGPAARRIGIAAIAVTLMVLAAAFTVAFTGGGVTSRPPGLDAAHGTTAGHRPPDLTGAGPEPGDLTRDWSMTTVGATDASYRLVGGVLLVKSTTAIEAYDASTGTLRWYLRVARHGEYIPTYRANDQYVLVERDATSAPTLETMLDAASGRVLWNKPLDSITSGIYDGVVTMTRTRTINGYEIPIIEAVDARTGDLKWSFRDDVRPNCEIDTGPEQANEGLLIFHASCYHQDTLMAFQASDGRFAWNRPDPGHTTTDANTLGSVRYRTPTSGRVSITRPDGHTVATLPANFTLDPLVAPVAAGDYAVFPGDSKEADASYLAVVNTRTGAATIHQTSIIRALASDGRHAYAVVGNVGSGREFPAIDPSVDAALLPAGVDVTDLATGATQRLPLPTPGGNALVGSFSYPYWIGAAGGRLFLAIKSQSSNGTTARIELMAVSVAGTAKPLELGGVPARDWPDPCTLAPGYRVVPNRTDPGPVQLGGITLPRVSCAYAIAGKTVTVTTAWIARTPADAHAMMSDFESGVLQPVGDEAFSYPGTDGNGAATVMRVGSRIVTVLFDYMPMLPNAADQRLLATIAASLRR